MTHGKTYNKSPRRINNKATKSKTNTGTTALERSVEQITGGFKGLLQLANFTLGPDAILNTEIHKNSVRIVNKTNTYDSYIIWKKNFIYICNLVCNNLVQNMCTKKKSKRKVQGVQQSQTAALPRHQEEEETDKTKQAQIEQKYEKY